MTAECTTIFFILKSFFYYADKKIHSTDELKQRLTEVSCALEHYVIDETLHQWRKWLSGDVDDANTL